MKTKPNPLETETVELGTAPNTMNCDFIRTLIDNYRKNQLMSVKDTMGIDDAHAIHFDLATLKKFISDIEADAQKTHPKATPEDLGIRFYYAAYPKTADWDIMAGTPIGQEYAERHTLVMVPTVKREDENGESLCYDFSPINASTANTGEMIAMASARGTGSQGDLISQNHGSLSPPSDPKLELF
ncbi:hypothetical protein QE422_003919 [Chryseobacterium sp. SORGH_AS 447]|uniref:hypothetical protein n=1 Tax=Chryseobacterium sp. SORGH_AS_0447 TaxID=3041769 RepID=UPI00277F9283|nr:hypothetical protein [Chryseobacterium sp. SORGH_AS_0447]MDQ1163551.1 hypothetical protein [Chryseobacterium sp. SORGH_AS_0447]